MKRKQKVKSALDIPPKGKQIKLIEESFESCSGTLKAIIDDYAIDDGAIVEINAAMDKIKNNLVEMVEEDPTKEELLKQLTNEALYEEDLEQILSILPDSDKQSIVKSFASECGYKLIKINSLADQEKLDSFVEGEIYPYYADQLAFIL